MNKLLASTALGAMLTLSGGANAAVVNLLTNGSFETGNFSGWTLSGNLGFLGVATSFSGVLPEDGHYLAYAGAVGSNNVLSQTFADVAGDTYTMTGWVYGFGGRPSDLGLNITDSLDNPLASIFINPYPRSGWTEYSLSFVGSGLDKFTILSRNDPSYQLLDNFQILNTTIPEASTWAMMLLGMAGLGFAGYRKAQSTESPMFGA
jgi:hypothetical protein